MALPTPPPYTNPIPNNPFYSPLNPYVCGPWFPVAIGAGIDLTTGSTVPELVNDVQNVLSAGPGIALSTFLGVTTISATGGGGGGSPATPTVEGIVYGCTDCTNFNYGLGDGIFGALTTGILNIAIGSGSMALTDTGTSNTAIGIGTLYTNTSGTQNVAIGQQALFANTSGGQNVAVGPQALQNATADANTALGNFAGNNVTTGANNIIIGQAGAPAFPVFDVTTENNRIVMGNIAATNAYIQVAWSAVSDARDKTNVAALPVGLDFVNRLNPVSFQFKESRECDIPHGPVRYGFLAQEVLAEEGENPVIIDTEDPDKLKMTNDYMNAVLVKAIQELSAKVDALEAKYGSEG